MIEPWEVRFAAMAEENAALRAQVEELTRERDEAYSMRDNVYRREAMEHLERAEQAERERDAKRDEGREQTERAIHFMRRCDEAEAKLARVVEALDAVHGTEPSVNWKDGKAYEYCPLCDDQAWPCAAVGLLAAAIRERAK